MESQIHIVGPLLLQNQLLCARLEKETGVPCSACQDLDPTEIFDTGEENNKRTLILLDCLNTDITNLWTELGPCLDGNVKNCFVALFNFSPDLEIRKEDLKRGVRGIFFESDLLAGLARGVQAILNGELWFSRDTLAKCLFEKPELIRSRQERPASLTPREQEILMMIAHGATNDKIADELYISPNTVKTHVYTIFQKINVPNRLQAALWASTNLNL